MTPKAPEETADQKAQRLRAETDNVKSIQDTVAQRTDMFQRRKSNKVNLSGSKARVSIT